MPEGPPPNRCRGTDRGSLAYLPKRYRRETRAGRSEDDEEPGAGEGEGRRAAAAAGGLERKVRATGRKGHM